MDKPISPFEREIQGFRDFIIEKESLEPEDMLDLDFLDLHDLF